MTKKTLVLTFFLLVILIGCEGEKDDRTLESDTWKSLVNNEWSNLDVWAGRGFYFHEDEGTAYCTFMIYGSGVRVMGHYRSIVDINEEGSIFISLPEYVSSGFLSDAENQSEELVEVILTFRDNAIILNDYKFEVQEGISNYKYIVDIVE